jgi:hypothetical protein
MREGARNILAQAPLSLDASNEGLVNSMLDSAMQPAHVSQWLSPDCEPKQRNDICR